MAAPHPRLLLGDSSACVYPSNVLDILVELVVCIREVGAMYHEVGELRRARAESEERAAAIRADLQRFARQAEVGLRATAGDSRWGEVHQHAEKAIGSLHSSVKRWQRYYSKETEREQRRLHYRIGGIEEVLVARIGRFLVQRRTESPARTLHRVLEGRGYKDVLEMEVFRGLTVRMALAAPASPRKVKSFARGVEIQLGMRKPFLRDEQPNRILLDDLYVVAATIGPAGAELQVAKKPNGDGMVDLGLGLQHGVVTAVGQLGEGQEFDVPSDDRAALSILWRGLITEVADAARAPAEMLEIYLDRDRVTDADDVFATLVRVVDHYRPIVAELAAHSPSADELSIKIEVEEGHREEVFVYRADLAQHILALPPGIREQVAIRELVGGDDEYVRESDLIDLGAIVQPDAGQDSDIIALTHPLRTLEDRSGPVMQLLADDIQIVDEDERTLEFTDEEISACFDLTGVRRQATR